LNIRVTPRENYRGEYEGGKIDMPRFSILWSLQGHTVIEAATAAEAERLFAEIPVERFRAPSVEWDLVHLDTLIETSPGVFAEQPKPVWHLTVLDQRFHQVVHKTAHSKDEIEAAAAEVAQEWPDAQIWIRPPNAEEVYLWTVRQETRELIATASDAPCEMIRLRSSNIASIGYIAATRELRVLFKSGGHYAYEGVPVELFDTLRKAKSPGRIHRDHIKDKFPYRKLTPIGD
jgi:hypothetical protein